MLQVHDCFKTNGTNPKNARCPLTLRKCDCLSSSRVCKRLLHWSQGNLACSSCLVKTFPVVIVKILVFSIIPYIFLKQQEQIVLCLITSIKLNFIIGVQCLFFFFFLFSPLMFLFMILRLLFFSQNMEILSSLEGAPMRIIKAPFPPPPPPPPSCVSAARSVQGHPSGGSSTSPPTTSSSEPRADPPRMATIEEDSSGDSPPGTAFPPSAAAAKSFEDLTEHSPLNRQNRRLQRQARVESKETEC